MYYNMKLKKVVKSAAKDKKWTAIFTLNDNKEKKVHFGQYGATDYTKGATDEQRKAYRSRHAKEKSQAPDTPGQLSYSLLWGDSRSMDTNIVKFKRKYSL